MAIFKKKVWYVILVFGLLFMFVAACSTDEDTTSENGTGGEEPQETEENNTEDPGDEAGEEAVEEELAGEIEFMTISLIPAFEDYLNNLIKEFEDLHPNVKVTLRDVPYDQVEQIVLTQASGGQMPDVMNLNTDFVKKLAAFGALVNMDEAAADVKADYFEGLWTSGYLAGGTYALPWYVTTSGLIYNPDILAEAGFDSPPATYDEAWEMSKVIYEKTGAYGQIVGDEMHMLFPKEGINILNEDDSAAAFNTPEAVEMWTKLKEYYDAGLFPEDVMLGQIAMPELYSQERVAWWSTGPQLFRHVRDLAPDIYEKSGAGPALEGRAGKQHANLMNIAVAENSKAKAAAVEFAKFVTNADNQLAFGQEAAILPSVIEAAENEFFTQGEDSDDATEKGRYFAARQLETAVNMTPAVEEVSMINRTIREAFHRVILEGMDPAEALNQAEAEVNELLN